MTQLRDGRTTCACKECQQCCRMQPGHLLPGDMERIATHLEVPLEGVKAFFWASPGAMVMDSRTNRQFRIGTITPKFDRRRKACVFLTDEGQCGIHPVAPFGCAFFNACDVSHRYVQEARQRSMWGMQQIQESPEYKALRDTLPFADHYQPKGY